ncbi:helix-turn-helix domain-containing protein, partial [Listeria monocytogenes]|nr:helix-turn-helix domain-containing protein [Listeria monocytogenes]MEB10870.1 helix-turn-helix domain-containing protein [Listeria monocytogenes]
MTGMARIEYGEEIQKSLLVLYS